MRDPLLLTALLLAGALLRTGGRPIAPPIDLYEALAEAPTLVPKLAEDGVERLSWLPGVGVGRARQIVEQRPYLPSKLSAEDLALLRGVGERTALEAATWLEDRSDGFDVPRRE